MYHFKMLKNIYLNKKLNLFRIKAILLYLNLKTDDNGNQFIAFQIKIFIIDLIFFLCQ